MFFYATHNIYADENTGSSGFANTQEISRFKTGEERDIFVKNTYRARAITRKEAVSVFANCYLSVGRSVPVGGLFGRNGYFWNENA